MLILLSVQLFFTLAYNYFTRFYTYFLLIITIHIINIMSQDHEQQQERIRLKNQTKALYQATRRANPVSRSLEQSSDTARKCVAREEPGVREQETEQRAAAREVPGVREHETEQRPVTSSVTESVTKQSIGIWYSTYAESW